MSLVELKANFEEILERLSEQICRKKNTTETLDGEMLKNA